QLGPVTGEQLRELALAGTIGPESMVVPEGSEKWVPAAKVKGLFPRPAPAASPPFAQALIQCPKCGRRIPVQQHELSLLVECAKGGTRFVPSKARMHDSASAATLDDPSLLGLIKDAGPEEVMAVPASAASHKVNLPDKQDAPYAAPPRRHVRARV